MSTEDDAGDVVSRLRQRQQVENMERDTDENINIGEARREVTSLESLFPRVSLAQTEEQDGKISSFIINVRTLAPTMLQPLTGRLVIMRARMFTRVKAPSKSITNIRVISSRDITLPLIETPTGRKFDTVRVDVE